MATDRTTGAALQPEINPPDDAANEPAFTPTFPCVQLLVLEEGASRVRRNNENLKTDELWLGDAYNPATPDLPGISVYLRLGQPAPLVAELLCCVIARMLGLPAPEPFVVCVTQAALPDSKLACQKGTQLCVATRDLGGATFAQLLRRDSTTAEKMISRWEHLIPVTVLDEWLANTDRNYDNIIYIAQTLHIIDHADAFGGSTRALFPLADITHDAFTNKLALFLCKDDPSPAQRQNWLDQARAWIAQAASGIDVAAAVAMAEVTRWQSTEEEVELIHFITTRLTITHGLLCQRLGHPQLPLPKSSEAA